MRRTLLAASAALALAAAGCGGDDGAGVRTIDGGGGSISGSGSASGSASGTSESDSASGTEEATDEQTSEDASASGSGSASASASGVAAECEPVGDVSTADTTVDVALTEWAIAPTPAEAAAGTIGFTASTEQAAEPHELVIVKGDDPQGLPTDADGAVDESQLEDGALVGEIEAFPAGTTCEGAFDLPAGDYVLFCNIVETEEDGTVEAHYAEGMTTAFSVS